MAEDTTASPAVTEGTGQTPAGSQAGTPGAPSAPTPAPSITFTPEQQVEVSRIAAQARTEGRTAGQTAAQQEAARQEAQRQAAAQAEQGQFKPLYEQAQAKITTLETRLQTMERQALITRIAGEANLPPNLHKFIVGADEAEITASVQELAAAVRPPTAPQTGAGQGTRPVPQPTSPTPAAGTQPARYSFVQPGDVPWRD